MIYWDNSSTTPCAPEVVDAMQPYWSNEYGNPSSAHLMGRRAASALRQAREQVAGLANGLPHEIIFTSGATESNNLLLLGVLLTPKCKRREIVVSAIEHKSILEPANLLEKHGFKITLLPVTSKGVVDLGAAKALITDEVLLVSVQTVNNELGTIQPVEELSEIAHSNGAYFHTDAAQAFGKIPFDVESINCDFASFSSHKMYGPKGVGALFIRGGAKAWPWETPFKGGGQEFGIRPGTESVPLIVGFGVACEFFDSNYEQRAKRLKKAVNRLVDELKRLQISAVLLNDLSNSIPGTASLLFKKIPADLLIAQMKEIHISRSSACNGIEVASHVIKAIVSDQSLHNNVIRISFGDFSILKEVDRFAQNIADLEKELTP